MKVDIHTDRINRGMSQQALADEIGVSVDVIRNLEETGRRPRPANALRIASFYGLTVTEMWPPEDDKEAARPTAAVSTGRKAEGVQR